MSNGLVDEIRYQKACRIAILFVGTWSKNARLADVVCRRVPKSHLGQFEAASRPTTGSVPNARFSKDGWRPPSDYCRRPFTSFHIKSASRPQKIAGRIFLALR